MGPEFRAPAKADRPTVGDSDGRQVSTQIPFIGPRERDTPFKPRSARRAERRGAVSRRAQFLAEVERIEKEMRDERDALFDPPWTTFNVGLIHGGKARNILAGECTFSLEWRPIPGQDPERALRLFDAAAEEVARRSGRGVKVTRTPMRLDDAAVTRADAPLVQFLEAESGARARTIPFGTELPELIALGAEGCVFGPGDIRVAHRTGEHVPIEELERCGGILERAVLRFCGEA